MGKIQEPEFLHADRLLLIFFIEDVFFLGGGLVYYAWFFVDQQNAGTTVDLRLDKMVFTVSHRRRYDQFTVFSAL